MADGSTIITYNYYSDGSYQKIATTTSAMGEITVDTQSFNPQGKMLTDDLSNPDGSHSRTTYTYDTGGTLQRILQSATQVDNSRVDTTTSYQADGSHTVSIVASGSNGASTSNTLRSYGTQGQLLEERTNGSAGSSDTIYQYATGTTTLQSIHRSGVNGDGSSFNETDSYAPSGSVQHIDKSVSAVDGSQVHTTTDYRPDGSHTLSVVDTTASGRMISNTNDQYGTAGQILEERVDGLAGSSDTLYQYNSAASGPPTLQSVQRSATNPDGSRLTEVDSYAPNGVLVNTDTTVWNVDGSQVHTTTAYGPDGSRSVSVTDTGGNHTVISNTVDTYGPQGQLLEERVNGPAASSDTRYQYAAGSTTLQNVQRSGSSPDGSSFNEMDSYNPDGSVQHKDQSVINFDGSQVHTATNYAPDRSYTVTVTDTAANGVQILNSVDAYDNQGHLLHEQITRPGNWVISDNKTSSYYPNGSLQHTDESVVNVDGSQVRTATDYLTDGSHTVSVTDTAGNGRQTLNTFDNYGSQGQLLEERINGPTSSSDTVYRYANGSTTLQSVQRNSGGINGPNTNELDTYDQNGSLQHTDKNVVNADGSQVHISADYQPGGAHSVTVTNMGSNGAQVSATFDSYGSQGQLLEERVNGVSSSSDTMYLYATGSTTLQSVQRTSGGVDQPTINEMDVYDPHGFLQHIDKSATNVDGSQVRTTADYLPNGAHSVTVTNVGSNGTQLSTTFDSYGPQGQLLEEQINRPSSSSDTTYQYAGTALQTVQQRTSNRDGSSSNELDYYDSQGVLRHTDKSAVNADGSQVHTTADYAPDGSHSVSVTNTAANGMQVSTRFDAYSSQGQLQEERISGPTGSTDTLYQSFSNGTPPQVVMQTTSKANGYSSVKGYTYHSDGSYEEAAHISGPGGVAVSQNNLSHSSNGSYGDNWSLPDGTHGNYSWMTSSLDYQASWYDSNGTSWTDEYVFAPGGSPATGGSFTETFSSSDGSHGQRTYDAISGATSLVWDSSATGHLTGQIGATGFVGLQNDDGLTNRQSDLTFFNANSSPDFAAFLAAHSAHA